MKTTFYLDGKKTTRKAISEIIGAERLDRYIGEAKAAFREDPLTENDWYIGRGIMTIRFE